MEPGALPDRVAPGRNFSGLLSCAFFAEPVPASAACVSDRKVMRPKRAVQLQRIVWLASVKPLSETLIESANALAHPPN